jgi:hypothetical protein
MSVWCLLKLYDDGGEILLGIFATEALAKEEMARLEPECSFTPLTVEEWGVTSE